MCVIIHKLPGVIIPEEDLESATQVNHDGYGFIIRHDNGSLQVIKNLIPDAAFRNSNLYFEEVYSIYKKYIEHEIFLHLRYQTKGTLNIENCHPHQILNQKEHGLDVYFMHNGTLAKFGTDTQSDSLCFAQQLLQPLFVSALNIYGPEDLLKHSYIQNILEKFADVSNKFAVVSPYGHYIANKEKGCIRKGFWASNEYSFNKDHRSSSSSSYYNGASAYGYNNQYRYREYEEYDNSTTQKPSITLPFVSNVTQSTTSSINTTLGASLSYPEDQQYRNKLETDTRTQAVREVFKGVKGPMTSAQLAEWHKEIKGQTVSFTELAGIDHLFEVLKLTPDDIRELQEMYPEATVMLIIELLQHLYITKLNPSHTVDIPMVA